MAFRKKRIKQRGRNAVPEQYRRKGKSKKGLFIAGGALLLCVIAACILVPKLLSQQSAVPTEPTTPPPDKVIHFVAGGDVNITDKTVASGAANAGYDYTEAFKDVLPVLSGGDVATLNFEGVVGTGGYGSATKMAPQAMLEALSAAGVDALQTANSYSIYDGLRGLRNTLQGVQNAGMMPLGTYATNAEFDSAGGYVIWEVGGIKVALMAFTKGMDGMGLPAGSERCVNLLYEDYSSTYQKVNRAGITKVVRNAAAHQPDVMVALVHWGSEFNDQISKSQKKICEIFWEEGVDAIIGTHPHYVQKMEFDPEKGTFLAYSLGDFFGDGEAAGTNYGVILDLEITKDGATGETKVTGFGYTPTFLETDENGKVRILRIREAMAGYENRYLDCVSEETYLEMKTALERIESRIGAAK